MKLNERLQERAENLLTEGLLLAETQWADYMIPLNEAYSKKRGVNLPRNLASTTAVCLENLNVWFKKRGLDAKRYIKEDTYPDAVGNFIHYGFDVITALIPSLSIEDAVSVQPMDRRIAEAFFLNFIKDTTKGASVAGDAYSNYKTGWSGDSKYTTDTSIGQVIEPTLAVQAYAGLLTTNLPLRPGTITLYVDIAGPVTIEGSDNGEGLITGDIEGNIDYALGTIDVSWTGESISALTSDYRYDMDRGMPPSLSLEIQSMALSATSRRMRTNWLMEAAIDLQKAHGKDADAELLNAVIGGIQNEISIDVYQQLLDGAEAGNSNFDTRPASLEIMRKLHNTQIVDHLVTMANKIYRKTRRGYGNFVVGGQDFCDLVEALPNTYFKAEADYKNPPAGPHKVGVLGGRFTVIKNLEYPDEKFLVGYKGDSYLDAGFIYAPYIPIYTTNPVALDDTKVRRGIGTSSATAMINGNMYMTGELYESEVPAP